jgi:hypothetical protein
MLRARTSDGRSFIFFVTKEEDQGVRDWSMGWRCDGILQCLTLGNTHHQWVDAPRRRYCMTVKNIVSVSAEIAGRTMTLEAGRFAEQADGAVTVRYGDTMLLATVVAASWPVTGSIFSH